MKKIFIALMLTMGLAGMTSCEKENSESNNQTREIFYTVSEHSALSVFDGTTVRLTTEAEFDALLDRFCDYTQSGEQVMFVGTRPSQMKGNASDTPTTISTSDREELKAWMKEMEKAGKTVRVTYDNGTWNGTAYVNLGQDDTQQAQLYTGTLVLAPTPVLENPPLGGAVWAMQLADGSTLILTVHGMMMWNESETPEGDVELLIGAELQLVGVAGTHTDLNGTPFQTLSLQVENEK